jgi:hypothetical protein
MPFPAGVSDQSPANPHGTKRQRRPSVRLGEIGDRPAAFLAERRNKKETVGQSASLSLERIKEAADRSSGFPSERGKKGTAGKPTALFTGIRKEEAFDKSVDFVSERRTNQELSPFLAGENKEAVTVDEDGSSMTDRRKKHASALSNHSRSKLDTADLGSVRATVCTVANGRKSGKRYHAGDDMQNVVMPPDVSSNYTAMVPKVSRLDLNQSSHVAKCKRPPEKNKINGEGQNTSPCPKLDSLNEDVEENMKDSDSEGRKEVHSDDEQEDHLKDVHFDDEEEGNMEDIRSDEGNECHTIQDCDLDDLGYQNHMKITSSSTESGSFVRSQEEQNSHKISTEHLPGERQEEHEQTDGNLRPWKSWKQNYGGRKKNCMDDSKAKASQGGREEENWNGISKCRESKEGSEQPFGLLNGVAGWLQKLGLTKYAQHFEDHEVDPQVLPLLTLNDLKEMGISAVGSRRKMFCAIRQLANCL